MSSVRHNQKHSSLKFALFVSLLALVGAAFVADLLWTSSSSSTLFAFRYVTYSWSVSYSPTLNLPNSSYSSQSKVKGKDQGKNIPAERILSATFADLPGPEPHWEKLPTAPVPRLDEAAIQIKNLLYVFAGYGNINAVHSHVDIFNFTNTWGESFPMPKEMAHSHLVVTDGRYIYVVTGQYGPQCRGPTARNFVLDTDTKQWKDLLLCQSLGILVYKFYGEQLREMFGYQEHPYGFYIMAVLAIILVGLLYGFFIAIICGQRINERHYHVLAKQELTKEYVVEDRECKNVPELDPSQISELRMLGLY